MQELLRSTSSDRVTELAMAVFSLTTSPLQLVIKLNTAMALWYSGISGVPKGNHG